MKKSFIIILIIIIISTNIYSQIINFSFSPQANDIGLFFISKPKFEYRNPISIYSSVEIGRYDIINVSIFRTAVGISSQFDDYVNISLAPCFNFYNEDDLKKMFKVDIKPISLEVGFTFKIKEFNNSYLSLIYDPFNYHFKFGLGLKF